MADFSSYAEFFLTHPEVLTQIREVFGAEVYTDGNYICDPRRDEHENGQAIASVALEFNTLHVRPFDDDGPLDFAIVFETA